MDKVSEKEIILLQKYLLKWFKQNGRQFPWRKNGLSPYQLIIAEILLQRTKAETVSKFYHDFINKFNSWEDIYDTPNREIEEWLSPLGLYRQRASRLKKLAEEMVKRKGVLPRKREDLDSIPFMGQYIANAVELMVFNRPMPLVDINMSRLIERMWGARQKADIRYDNHLQEISYKIVNHSKSKEINWAILDFAAIICKKNNPMCLECMFSSNCKYYNDVSNNSRPFKKSFS